MSYKQFAEGILCMFSLVIKLGYTLLLTITKGLFIFLIGFIYQVNINNGESI